MFFEDIEGDGSHSGGIVADSGVGDHCVEVGDFVGCLEGFDSEGWCLFLDGVNFDENELAAGSFWELREGLGVLVCGGADGGYDCVVWEGEIVGYQASSNS